MGVDIPPSLAYQVGLRQYLSDHIVQGWRRASNAADVGAIRVTQTSQLVPNGVPSLRAFV